MKHPDAADWMDYLYDEGMSSHRRSDLQAHLQTCPECQEQLDSWNGVRACLDQWKLAPNANRSAFSWKSWVAAAAAAIVLFSAGAAAGRQFFPAVQDQVALDENLLRQVRQEMAPLLAEAQSTTQGNAQLDAQDLLAEYAARQEQRRQEDLETLLALMRQSDARHAANYSELRRGLETVAVATDTTFRLAQDQMVHLASFPVANRPLTTDEP